MPTTLRNATYYTIAEAAEFLGLTAGRIRQLIGQPDGIPGTLCDDRLWLIRQQDLLRYNRTRHQRRVRARQADR